MLLAFKSKNKLKFIDGSLPKPDENDSVFESWKRCNTYVVSWINLSLSPSISQSVIWMNVASDLWNDLKRRYYHGDRFWVAELHEEFYVVRQGDMDVTTYFTKLRSIWEDIENFRMIPSCECGKDCKCGLGVVRRYKSEDQVTCFLRGLNDQYSAVRSQIMLMDPLPDIHTALSMLSQQERQQHSLEPISIDRLVAYSATSSNTMDFSQNRGRGRGRRGRQQAGGRGGRGRQQGRMQCSHCEKLGHTIETCYKKHGLPPHLRQRNGGEAAVNIMTTANTEVANGELSMQLGESETSNSGFTAEQKEALLALLHTNELRNIHSTSQIVTSQQSPPHQGNLVHVLHFKTSVKALNISKQKCKSWVIDTGATNHVSYTLDDFQSYQQIDPIIVKLPNGSYTTSSIIGTIVFSEKLYLKNALYIPSFNFKLISVSKLTATLHCTMNFSEKLCEIQDCSSLRMIGKAEVVGGLYTLNKEHSLHTNSAPYIMSIQGTQDRSLWHCRLGHPSLNSLKSIQKIYHFTTCNDTEMLPCNACHLAKQRKLPFAASNKIASYCLELIHVDI
ncbi:uncharacterized protein [Arachis hypogaea]|uniref:uncharacterized protein n=1 Tax=Arachis hypogaea TaxID=3818 RepID=UPI003B2252D9